MQYDTTKKQTMTYGSLSPLVECITSVSAQFFFKFWIVRLLALRPLLAYCARIG
jgi:hypothetical protein